MRSFIAFTAATIVATSPAMAQKAEKEARRPSLERLNKSVEALDSYNRFIERAPRRLERQIGLAKSRIAELSRAVSGTSEEGRGSGQ